MKWSERASVFAEWAAVFCMIAAGLFILTCTGLLIGMTFWSWP